MLTKERVTFHKTAMRLSVRTKEDGTRHEASKKDGKTNLEKTKISETEACAREFDPASYEHGYDGAVHGQGSNRRSDGLLREPLQRREGEHGRGLSSSRLLAKLLDSQNRGERGMRDAHTSSTRNTKNTFEKEKQRRRNHSSNSGSTVRKNKQKHSQKT